MKHVDTVIQLIESLNGDIGDFNNNYPKIETDHPGWLEEAKRRSRELTSKFENEINNLNNELIIGWRQYSKQDILQLQHVLKKTVKVSSIIGIGASKLNVNNLTDAFFLLLLKGKHSFDYRDRILELNNLIDFAVKNKIDYKNAGKMVSVLFDNFEFHDYFKKIIAD